MKLEEINNEIEKDSKVSDKLDNEALKIPYIYGKWINIHSMEKAYLIKYNRDKDKMVFWKTDYYKGISNEEYKDGKISPIKYNTNAEKASALAGDTEILDLIQKVELQKVKIETIEYFLKAIHSMGFNIQTAIKYQMWINGSG